MTPIRRLAVLGVGLTLALAGGATAWLTTAQAAAPAITPTPPGVQPAGVNFTIRTNVDRNFCMSAQPVPSVPASEASMAQCAPNDDQHWTLAATAQGYIVIISGRGQCLDFAAKAPALVSVVPCSFKGAEHFYYDDTSGLVESVSGKKCLSASAAALNAELSIVKCDVSEPLQIWYLGH